MADLTTLTDDQLDTALAREWDDRRRALSSGATIEAQACHLAAEAILAEQSRRLDAWLAGRVD